MTIREAAVNLYTELKSAKDFIGTNIKDNKILVYVEDKSEYIMSMVPTFYEGFETEVLYSQAFIGLSEKWVACSDRLPDTEDYYSVRYSNGVEDRKPFRIRPSRGIRGFMTEDNVVAWREK